MSAEYRPTLMQAVKKALSETGSSKFNSVQFFNFSRNLMFSQNTEMKISLVLLFIDYSSTLSQRRYSIDQAQQNRPKLSYMNSE